MRPDFSGKIVVVTGAAKGIGRKTAGLFAEFGATVIVSDIMEPAGRETVAALGPNASYIKCDIGDPCQVESLIDQTVERYGCLDIMVNNAGVNAYPSERVTTDKYLNDTWHRIIDIDLCGTYYCCRFASAQMVKQKSGSIINIASVAGVVALRLQIAFVAAKAAVIKMTEAMACELAPSGVRVNVVSPGSTITEENSKAFFDCNNEYNDLASRIASFIPQGRIGESSEIAEAVVFLASDSASYINGHNLVVDGGWTSGFNRDF